MPFASVTSDRPSRRFEGKVAVVLGASRGIGYAVAERLISEGASVYATARHEEDLAAAASLVGDTHLETIAGRADDPDHRHEVLDRVATRSGRLDVLVDCVGINPVYGPMIELEAGAGLKMLEVNVLTALAWIRACVADRRLGFANAGAVVAISSVTGSTPSPGLGMYGVTKAALEHLIRTLAVELAPGVRVNAVAPAVIRTSFSRMLYEGKETEVTERYPLARLGSPEDVAAAVAFLASHDASWITGHTLVVDGGLLAAGGIA